MPQIQDFQQPEYYADAALIGMGVLMTILVIMLIILIPMYIVNSIAYSKIAKKIGFEHPWLAWVPYGAHFISIKAGNLSPFLLLLIGVNSFISAAPELSGYFMFLTAIISAVTLIYIDYHMLPAFGKNKDLAYLHLIPGIGSLIVWIIILNIAFDSDNTYQKKDEAPAVPEVTETP